MTDIVGAIFAAKAAAAVEPWSEMAGKPYRPGSGTEGMCFDEHWCDHCTRDAAWRDDPDRAEGCSILSATFVLDITDPDYPKEWIYDREGVPCCTAFTTDPSQPMRCDKTLDLFGDAR